MSYKKRRNVHVVPTGDGRTFVARLAGGNTLPMEPTTQRDAIRQAMTEARARRSEVVIHRRDGRIRDKDSYGHDSPLVKDTKH